MAERLQKILAGAGYGSRRKCETLILEGRVSVDGEVVSELGAKADAATQTLAVDGKPVSLPRLVYVLMNKPAGFITTVSDPHATRTVMQLLPDLPAQVHPVGRLDKETEGVLLFTNDGELTHRLTHPRYGVEKVYRAAVRPIPDAKALRTLRQGVKLSDGKTGPAEVTIRFADAQEGRATLEMVIHEGRKRQVRRMLGAVGLRVDRLVRTRVGNLSAYKLPKGACRLVSKQELDRLRRLAGLR